jgi:regulator of protease activity HflC (stomatin/prohibitin superfamily)
MQANEWGDREARGPRRSSPFRGPGLLLGVGGVLVLAVLATVVISYDACKIEVQTGEQAVLIRREGLDLKPEMELAPPYTPGGPYTKGVQQGVLTEGRYFYNPLYWDWEIRPQYVVHEGKCGVRISLQGDDLSPGQILAGAGQKGVRPGVLESGARVAYNWYAEQFEEYDPVVVPPGCRGVVTLLAGREPKDPNVVLVAKGDRGVQKETRPPGTYYVNPYEERISIVDCRSQRFALGQERDMSFLSSDGFEVSIDGVIEFRVMEDRVAEAFVLYNEDFNGDGLDEEIIAKIITPESRSICRVNGSKMAGGQFLSDSGTFKENLEKSLKANCLTQGVEILNVSITSIRPPQEIRDPVQAREVAKQQLTQFQQEKLQQESEAQLRVQTLLADQKKALVEAEQTVIEQTTKAEQDQQVAQTLAEQKLAVAQTQLEATKDKAAALIAEAKAAADVIRFKNTAELSGLAARVGAFDGDGAALAQNILVGKLAPAFRTILSNSDGPLMELFGQFSRTSPPSSPRRPTAGPAIAADRTPTETSSSETAKLPRDPFHTNSAEARP